jgi:high-affinity nickel-transport protein
VLHGLGAETGTQVLLIAAVGGASEHGLSIAMLMAFVVGLIISNTAVAIVSGSGFSTSMRMRPLYLFTGGTACVFSLLVGLFFVSGHAENLPTLVAF